MSLSAGIPHSVAITSVSRSRLCDIAAENPVLPVANQFSKAANRVGELLAFFLASERLSAARSTKPLSVSQFGVDGCNVGLVPLVRLSNCSLSRRAVRAVSIRIEAKGGRCCECVTSVAALLCLLSSFFPSSLPRSRQD